MTNAKPPGTRQKPGTKLRHETPLDEMVRGCVQASEKTAVWEAVKAVGGSESTWVRAAVLEKLGRGWKEGPPPVPDFETVPSRQKLVSRTDRPWAFAFAQWVGIGDIAQHWALSWSHAIDPEELTVVDEDVDPRDWPKNYLWHELPTAPGCEG